LIDTGPKLTQVLSSRAALKAMRRAVVWIEPPGVTIELKLHEGHAGWLSENQIDSVTLHELSDIGVSFCQETTEVVAKH
jgi:hypothetical protein